MDNVFKVIHRDPVEKDHIYCEIGRFIFEFSQSEATVQLAWQPRHIRSED